MKIAPIINGHLMFIRAIVLLVVLALAQPVFSSVHTCEEDFIAPTISLPNFQGLASGDTIFLVCSSGIFDSLQYEAEVVDNCDPNPLIKFNEYCINYGDCSRGYNYFAEYNWIAVDKNNNVAMYQIFAIIRDKTPPEITLNWDEGIYSGDTIKMECGYAENFDLFSVTAEDGCNPFLVCDPPNQDIHIFFQERIISEGDCSEYVTKMACSWTATDDCGNQSVFKIIVLLTDNTPPEFIDVPDQICGSSSLSEAEYQAYIQDLASIEVRDRCSTVDLSYTLDELSDGCEYMIEWEAIDDCGNVSYHQQNVCITSSSCVGQISGTVRQDNDKDQIGDEPIADVQLLLIEDLNGNGAVDGGETVYLTTNTDADGFYLFSDVPQGCYVIVELQPSGLLDSRDEDTTNPGGLDIDGSNDPTDNFIPVCLTAGEFDDGNNFVEEQVSLEIVLSAFDGRFDERNDRVFIDWKTEYEQGTDHFVLERSVDGATYAKIGEVVAQGTDNLGSEYTFIDRDLETSSTHYYRLAEVENNGVVNYSEIIFVKTPRQTETFKVYPNPARDILNILIEHSNNEPVEVELYDMSGRIALYQRIDNRDKEIDLSEVVPGAYLLKVNLPTKHYVKKIVVLP